MSPIVYPTQSHTMTTMTNTLTVQFFVDEVDDLETINPQFYTLIEDNLSIVDLSEDDDLYDDNIDYTYGVTVTFKNRQDLVSFTEGYLEIEVGPHFTQSDVDDYINRWSVN